MERNELGPRIFKLGLAALASVWLGAACGPIPDYRTLVEVDLHPPEFLGALARDSRRVVLRFDETVVALPKSVSLTPNVDIESVRGEDCELVVTLSSNQAVGTAYAIEASVEDTCGNSTSVITSFYGFNPDVPALLINEFITQGSTTHPDLVELLVLESGNTAGMCLYEGMPGNWDNRIVLPSIDVEAGDYLLVHFKPQGLAEEIDEVELTDLSGGLDASLAAYDLWVERGDGLSGNNGVLSLFRCPGGDIIDAVVYSNRTSDSDSNYGGFGSRDVYERVLELEPSGQWKRNGAHIAPEDAVDPDPSTATRSMCRGSNAGDSDSRADWHITPTSGSTFGEVNSDEVYVP